MKRKKAYVCGRKGEKEMYYGEVTWLGIIVFFIIVIIERRKERDRNKPYIPKEKYDKMVDEDIEKTRKMVNDTIDDLKRKGMWRKED